MANPSLFFRGDEFFPLLISSLIFLLLVLLLPSVSRAITS